MTGLLENFVQDARIEKSFWRPSLKLKVYSFLSLTYRQSSLKNTVILGQLSQKHCYTWSALFLDPLFTFRGHPLKGALTAQG